MKKCKLALIGATGVIGRVTRAVLEEKELPITDIEFYASSRSAGKEITFKGNEYYIKELNEQSFVYKNEADKIDYAIFTANGQIAQKYAPLAITNKCMVIDNSSNFRMNKDVPLIVP